MRMAYAPSGVAARLYGAVMLAGAPVAVVPITGLTPRGARSLPIDSHSELLVLSDITTTSPARVATTVRGVAMAKLALNGIGGKPILPTTRNWFKSIKLMLFPPPFPTEKVLP